MKKSLVILSIFLVCISLCSEANPRQKALMQKISAPQLQNPSTESHLRFTYPFGQTELQIINFRESGHWHLGLDLNLGVLLGSQALGELIEEYLLAYLMGAELKNYDLKANIPNMSKYELAAKISSFKKDLRINTQTGIRNAIRIELENPRIKLSFQIPLSLEALYAGQDKKDLEEGLLQRLLGTEPPLPELEYPSLEKLIPYKDSLYVWQRTVLDSLFTASLFLVAHDGRLSYLDNPRFPLETVLNYLLMPQAFKRELTIDLKYNMYGKRQESIRLAYPKLYSILSFGMQTAGLISAVKNGDPQLMLVFFDSLTGIRHILYGNLDPADIVSGRIQTINLKLMSHIIGSAEKMQYIPGKEPPWQVKIK